MLSMHIPSFVCKRIIQNDKELCANGALQKTDQTDRFSALYII